MTKKEEKEREAKDFDKLYKYIRKNVYHYDYNQSLPSTVVLAIKGLKTSKPIENKRIKATSNYPYRVILASFILNRNKIDYAMSHKNFKNEMQAFSYIRKIVEQDFNKIYIHVVEKDRQKKQNERMNNKIEINTETSYGTNHNTGETVKSHLLDDLW